MLTVGTTYEIVTLANNDQGQYEENVTRKTVHSVEGSIVVFADGSVQNLTSPLFHLAIDLDRVAEAHAAFEAELRD